MSAETYAKSQYISEPVGKVYKEDPLSQPVWFNLMVYILQSKSSAESPLTAADIEKELVKIIPFQKQVRRLTDIILNIKDIENVYDTISAVYGGKLVVLDGKPKKYYFEPFINPSDLNMIKGSIISDKYLSDKEKDYLTSVEDLLCPVQAGRELTNTSNLERPASIDKSNPYQVSNWFYSIQTIFEAIKKGYQLELTYGEYSLDSTRITIKPKLKVKNAENPYIIHPYALLWNNGHQYLIATTNDYKNPSHYRIDRIKKAVFHKIRDNSGNLVPAKRNPIPYSLRLFYKNNEFDVNRYTSVFPLMIASTDNKHFLTDVMLECPVFSLSVIIDYFGHKIKIYPSERFTEINGKSISFCKIELKRVCHESILMFCLQQQASVFSPFPKIVALAPKELVDDIKTKLRETLAYYENL